MCLFKLLGSLNGRPQNRHWSGLCPVWVRRWILSPYFRVYSLPQKMQMWVFGSFVGSKRFSIRGLAVESLRVGVNGHWTGLKLEILGLTLGVAAILSIWDSQANAMWILSGFGWLNEVPHWIHRYNWWLIMLDGLRKGICKCPRSAMDNHALSSWPGLIALQVLSIIELLENESKSTSIFLSSQLSAIRRNDIQLMCRLPTINLPLVSRPAWVGGKSFSS